MKKTIIAVLLVTILSTLYSCGSTNYEDDGMSYRYKTDSKYRHNVNSVAETYGKTPKAMEDSVENFLDAIH